MISNAINSYELLVVIANYPRNVLMEFRLVLSPKEILPTFNGKDYLDIYMCECICHSYLPAFCVAPDGAWGDVFVLCYKHYAPTGAIPGQRLSSLPNLPFETLGRCQKDFHAE